MGLIAGIDFGGSSVKAWVAAADGAVIAAASERTETQRPAADVAEFEPEAWWAAAGRALTHVLAKADGEIVAVTATSLRQGFVLIGERGELGNGVLNSDRRGLGQLDTLRRKVDVQRLYRLTGHWPAAELTLPKLMHLSATEPERWMATRVVLFVHDWALWRLCGQAATEASFACAGQMADVAARGWAVDLLNEVGIGPDRLAPLVEAGSVVGKVQRQQFGLAKGIPVVAGGGDTQVAAMGAGGLDPLTATIVAGSSTPIQAAVSRVPQDPLRHPWVSTHLRPDVWAIETNAGYGGMMLDWLASVSRRTPADVVEAASSSEPGARGVTAAVAAPVWSEERWTGRPSNATFGFTPAHSFADLARAFIEAHAYAIRSNLDDLERATGSAFKRVILTGGAARSEQFRRIVADVVGRPVSVPSSGTDPVATAGAALAGRALGTPSAPDLSFEEVEPRDHASYQSGYERFLATSEALVQFPRAAA